MNVFAAVKQRAALELERRHLVPATVTAAVMIAGVAACGRMPPPRDPGEETGRLMTLALKSGLTPDGRWYVADGSLLAIVGDRIAIVKEGGVQELQADEVDNVEVLPTARTRDDASRRNVGDAEDMEVILRPRHQRIPVSVFMAKDDPNAPDMIADLRATIAPLHTVGARRVPHAKP